MAKHRGDGPIYEAVSRRAHPEAHRRIDAQIRDIARSAHQLMGDDRVRELVAHIYPDFPPFLLNEDAYSRLLIICREFRRPRDLAFLRQQIELAGALEAHRRGESVEYLAEFASRNRKK